MPVGEQQVLTSTQATALYVRERFGATARVLAIGEEGLVRSLIAAGFKLVHRHPDVVVCGLDRRVTYERLKSACLAIKDGASFLATNPDLSLPTEHGFIPGNGATLAYIEAATGVEPTVIGKPEATMLDISMRLLGAEPGETAIIGDGLITDILAGERAGVTKILVLTGVAKREDLPASLAQPDLVVGDLPELQALLR
jgi:4-nitrophenyl phosphatase